MTSIRSQVGWLLLVAATSCPCLAVGAGEQARATASGKFAGRTKSFEVKDAYAYWSRSSNQEPIINVVVSNDVFDAEAFNAFYDPGPVIENRFVDEETAVVYFEFEPNGKYHGLSYQLAPGDNCGFCYDSKAKSTVRMAGQRLQGKLAFNDANRTFDVQIDVPVPAREWGKPIQGDGGEVGATFRAYNAAMEKDNRKAIFDLLDSQQQKRWKKNEKEGKLDSYMEYRMNEEHWRLKDAQIVGGFVRENEAVFLVKGRNPVIPRFHGQMAFVRENGRWKFREEVFEVGE